MCLGPADDLMECSSSDSGEKSLGLDGAGLLLAWPRGMGEREVLLLCLLGGRLLGLLGSLEYDLPSTPGWE